MPNRLNSFISILKLLTSTPYVLQAKALNNVHNHEPDTVGDAVEEGKYYAWIGNKICRISGFGARQ